MSGMPRGWEEAYARGKGVVNGLFDGGDDYIDIAKLAASEEERAEAVRNVAAASKRVVDNPSGTISGATGAAESYVRETSSAQMVEDGLRTAVANVIAGGRF